jgi:hypothetical protein
MENKNFTQLFWTGGWDSTFRLLQLLILNKNMVQPYYIVDHSRRSKENELNSMAEIRTALFSKFPFTKNLLLPTISFDLSNVVHNSVLNQSFLNLRNKRPLGIQYLWLSEFCLQLNLNNVDLSIESATGSGVDSLIAPILNKNSNKISLSYKDTDEYRIFNFYTFPLITMSKAEMQSIAEDQGFLDILVKSWFCHKPIFKRFTCGLCNPCKSVIKSDMGYRIHFIGKVNHRIHSLI